MNLTPRESFWVALTLMVILVLSIVLGFTTNEPGERIAAVISALFAIGFLVRVRVHVNEPKKGITSQG